MYVNPFWFGVIVTIVVEIVACVAYALFTQGNGGNK